MPKILGAPGLWAQTEIFAFIDYTTHRHCRENSHRLKRGVAWLIHAALFNGGAVTMCGHFLKRVPILPPGLGGYST